LIRFTGRILIAAGFLRAALSKEPL